MLGEVKLQVEAGGKRQNCGVLLVLVIFQANLAYDQKYFKDEKEGVHTGVFQLTKYATT